MKALFSLDTIFMAMKRNCLIKKMKIFNMLLFVFLTTAIQAKNHKWQPLKEISEYSASAFNLKKGIEYLEVRQYEVNEENKLRNKPYKTVLSFYRKSLNSFDNKTVKKFHKITPNLSKQSNISIHSLESDGIGCHYRYNGFSIDATGKMFSMNMIEDIVGFLGEINTPAEAQAVLWLHNKHKGNSYRKTSKGYDIIIEYEDSIAYCKAFKYRATINKRGQISKYKLLKSRPLTECMSVSWNPCDAE